MDGQTRRRRRRGYHAIYDAGFGRRYGTGWIAVYVNGSKVKTVPLTSYYNWQYFSSDHPGDTPSAGRPLFRFDEVHWKLDTPLKAGDTIRIQKTNGDNLEYGVDFLEIESVPAAISRPANAVSVTDFGAVANDGKDDLAAFEAAVQSAVSTGKTLYIPEGTFHLGSMWKIGTPTNMINNLTVVGAGIWHKYSIHQSECSIGWYLFPSARQTRLQQCLYELHAALAL